MDLLQLHVEVAIGGILSRHLKTAWHRLPTGPKSHLDGIQSDAMLVEESARYQLALGKAKARHMLKS